jgi:hypothetical protein
VSTLLFVPVVFAGVHRMLQHRREAHGATPGASPAVAAQEG